MAHLRPQVELLEERLALATTRMAVIGDFGVAGPAAQAVADLVHSWNPDFVVTTGDNNYPTGSASTIDANIGQYYHDFIFPYQGTYGAGAVTNAFFPTLGNHDWDTANAQPYLNYFTLPGNERYYTTTLGDVQWFVVDSDPREPDGITAGSVQGQWLQGALANSTAPWKIVVTHHAPFSSSSGHGSTPVLQWPFAAWGANAVLSGHDHDYERLQVGAVPYFVLGSSGNPTLYAFSMPLAASRVRYNADHGAMLLEADASHLRFEFYSVQGELLDSYVLDTATPTSALDVPLADYFHRGNWPGVIAGTAQPATGGGSAIQLVEASIRQDATGRYWDGSAFSAANETFLAAGGASTWSLPLAASAFSAGAYTIRSRAQDALGNMEIPGAGKTITFVTTPQQATVGIYSPSNATWYLRDAATPGSPTVSPFAYGFGSAIPMVGDWNGDGQTTIGVYDPATARWYQRDQNGSGAPTFASFAYGYGGVIPVVGDWDGNGTTTIGVYDPRTATWLLRDSNSPGAPTYTPFSYGFPGVVPVVGDWDGNGTTTIGVYDPRTATWYLRNSNSPGAPSINVFGYGFGSTPVVGDWDGDGDDTVGIYDPASARWYLRNSNTPGAPHVPVFSYGFGSRPVVGDWNFPSLPLLAAELGPGTDVPLLQSQLDAAVHGAWQRLRSGGMDAGTLARLAAASFTVTPLFGAALGQTEPDGRVAIDSDGAGYGWFLDPTPDADEEFVQQSARPASAAAGQMDLLSVILHEMGHVLGIGHGDALAEVLLPGTRLSLD